MPHLKPSGLARIPLIALDLAEELGLDPERLEAMAGLTEQKLADPDDRVPLRMLVATWQAVVALKPEESIGLRVGRSIKVRQLGLVGYTMVHSDTLQEAFRRLARYSRIIHEAEEISFEEGQEFGLRMRPLPALDAMRHPADSRLAVGVSVAREMTGSQVTPVEVSFPYPQPADTGELQRFFGAPLVFGRPYSSLTFRRQDLQHSLRDADRTLTGYLDQLAEKSLAELLQGGSLVEQVRRAIWTDLSGGRVSLERTSGRLGMGSRSLQRRLRKEGTSFMNVLDGLRHETAVQLLHDRHIAVYEIAFLLGYFDPSTFFRAFRRWEGMSPQEFRRANLQD
jgi:AraC-like DNA-binding protein